MVQRFPARSQLFERVKAQSAPHIHQGLVHSAAKHIGRWCQALLQANALWRYCRGGVDTHPSANLCGGINLPNFSPRMGVTLTHHPSAIDGVGFTALVACDQPCWHPHGAHQDDEGRSDVFTKACLLVKPKLVGGVLSVQTGF